MQYEIPPSFGYIPPSDSVSMSINGPGVELDLEEMSDTSCANLTPDDTSCTFYITEDGTYSVMFTESNEISSTTTNSSFVCKYS